MESNKLIFNEWSEVMPDCTICRNFEENDWCILPHREVKYYSCKIGGCKKLADYYNNLKFRGSFENDIIKKFLK